MILGQLYYFPSAQLGRFIFNLKNNHPCLFAINLNVSHVILEDSWDVDFWELIFAEHNQ